MFPRLLAAAALTLLAGCAPPLAPPPPVNPPGFGGQPHFVGTRFTLAAWHVHAASYRCEQAATLRCILHLVGAATEDDPDPVIVGVLGADDTGRTYAPTGQVRFVVTDAPGAAEGLTRRNALGEVDVVFDGLPAGNPVRRVLIGPYTLYVAP